MGESAFAVASAGQALRHGSGRAGSFGRLRTSPSTMLGIKFMKAEREKQSAFCYLERIFAAVEEIFLANGDWIQ